MDLYKIISQLTNEEYEEILSNFLENKAEKSATFLELIRRNPETPDKEFLSQYENVTPAAFYVLKSRLNQRVETFLLNRIGDPSLNIIKRVLNVNDLIYSNPREISVTALRRLERELVRFDFPYGLMVVYKELQNLHAFDDQKYKEYKDEYSKQVAYTLAIDKGSDMVVSFFRSFDSYYMTRREKDYQDMILTIEKIDNLNNLYDSHRLYIFKSLIHIFAKLFINVPIDIRCDLEDTEVMFEKSFEYLDEYQEDTLYKNLNLVFDYLRFLYYDSENVQDKSRIYFDILDYKIEELLTRYHFNVNTSFILFRKLQYHIKNNRRAELLYDVENHLNEIEIEPYRLSFYINFHLFRAYAYFFNEDYKHASKLLYNLRNEVNLRRKPHVDLETKFLLAICYVKMEDFDLANQKILSLQRQLRKGSLSDYQHAKTLLKILSTALGGRPKTRAKNLRNYLDKWNEQNIGRYALLDLLSMEDLFTIEEA